MARIPPDEDEKPLYWVGSSKKDLLRFPEPVREEVGSALGAAQFGGKAECAKPWHGEGSGVFEIVENHDGRAFRAVYVVRFEKAIYVLHAFEKKAKKGAKTPETDKELVTSRLRDAQRQYTADYERGAEDDEK